MGPVLVPLVLVIVSSPQPASILGDSAIGDWVAAAAATLNEVFLQNANQEGRQLLA